MMGNSYIGNNIILRHKITKRKVKQIHIAFQRHSLIKEREKRYYNTQHMNNHQDVVIPLDPEWIVGLTDAEGSFHLTNTKKGPVKPKFSMTWNIRDIDILIKLRAHFRNMGSISRVKENDSAIWTVNGNEDIITLIKFFSIYKLRTKKLRDFLIWKRALRYTLHDPKRLQYKNLLIKLRDREFPTKTPLSAKWLVGFIEGDGGFIISLRSKPLKTKPDRRVECSFQIVQKERLILNKIAQAIGAGGVYNNVKGKYLYKLPKEHLDKFRRFIHEDDFISPHKKLDYVNWMKIIEIVNNKKHLTEEGYNQVKALYSQMYIYLAI